MTKRNLALFLIALLFSVTLNLPAVCSSQSGDETLTLEERREAISLARRFVKRLGETRDIAPLIEEFFVSDFSPRDSTLLFEEAAPDAIDALSREELLRCYAAEFNLLYLIFLRTLSMDYADSSEETEEDIGLETFFPPDVFDLFVRNPDMAFLIGETEDEETSINEAEFRIQSPEQLRNIISCLQEGVKLMRNHVTQNPPEQSPYFKENFKDIAANLDIFNPSLQTRKESSDDPPAIGRVIKINIPFFQLTLVRSEGRLKIFCATILIDS